MSSQRTSPRKKLWPKKPSKVLKKRKTFVPYNRRDHKLTKHQQLWAQSLAVSLSGWRNRQSFLKTQLQAHLEAAAECEAQEAARQAAVQAQDVEREVKMQAEVAKRFAEEIAANKFDMHEAGIKDMTKEELDTEEYMYGDFNELVPARSYAEPGVDKDDDEYDDDDNDTSEDDFDIEAPQVRSPPKMQPAPIVQPAQVVDWRVKAHNGIIKKKLSIGKGWSAVTWNQKSNVHERLLLLEDDGFDITELQDRKTSSEEVTAIILERAARNQQPQVQMETSVQEPGTTKSSSAEHEALLPVPQSSMNRQSTPPVLAASSLREHPSSSNIRATATALREPSHRSVPTSQPQPMTTPVIEDSTQPFCLNKPYQPQVSPRLKRKRNCDSDSEDMKDTAAGSYHALKKRKVEYITEDVLRLQALQETKEKVLRRVFRPARSICRKSAPPSRVVFSAQTVLTKPGEKKKPISTLDYLYPERPSSKATEDSFDMSSCAFENMMSELRFMTNTSDETDGNISIYDPDYDEEPICGLVSAADRIKQNSRNFKREKSCITISTDNQGPTMFQGDTRTLAELFKVLREQELFHCIDWRWDGLKLSSSSSFLWSQSPATQNALMQIEHRLRRCARVEGVEICVDRVEDGQHCILEGCNDTKASS